VRRTLNRWSSDRDENGNSAGGQVVHHIDIDSSVYRIVWCLIGIVETAGWLALIFIAHGNPIFAAVMIAYTIVVLLGFWLVFKPRRPDMATPARPPRG